MREPGEKKYLHVADYVEGLIREGGLKPGDKLPSDRDLAGKLSATRVTVSKGLQVLADKGILERKVGSGSYVAESQATRKAKEGKLLGMLVHARSDAYAMMMVKAINEAAARQGAKLLTSSADGFGEESIRAAQTLDNDGCSALIIPWIPYLDYSGLPSFASKCPLPFTLPALIQGLESHCFETKDTVGKGGVLGTRSLCEYLYLLGERHIALLGPSTEGDIAMRDNLAAYSEFICKKGLDNISHLLGLEADEMDALAAKWAAFKGALAVVCYDDLFAVRFMTSMHKLGLSAPKDFRVVAWNDSPLAAFSDPPLTSLRPDYAYSGMKIVKCALAASEGKEWKSDVITPNTLVIRESCGGLKRLTPRLAGKIKELFFDIETPTLKQAGTEAVPA